MTALTRDELIDELKAHGFRGGETASTKWRIALARSNGSHTLVVLVRARGVDLLLTPLTVDEMLSPAGKLSVSMHGEGDRFVEYNYVEGEAPVHQQALSVASLFANGQPIDDSYFQKVGIGRAEAKARSRDGDMTEVYDALSDGDGEAVYLSDGVWLKPDGSTEDRGR